MAQSIAPQQLRQPAPHKTQRLGKVSLLLAYALLRPFGFDDRFSASIGIGLRNMGLLIAPILAVVPKNTFLYFALAQIPIYVAPVVLKAVKARLEPEKPREPRP